MLDSMIHDNFCLIDNNATDMQLVEGIAISKPICCEVDSLCYHFGNLKFESLKFFYSSKACKSTNIFSKVFCKSSNINQSLSCFSYVATSSNQHIIVSVLVLTRNHDREPIIEERIRFKKGNTNHIDARHYEAIKIDRFAALYLEVSTPEHLVISI